MRDPFSSYDEWLERPYQDMIAESDAYYDWADAEGLDPDEPATEAAYAEYLDSQYDYEALDDDYDDWEDDYYYEEAYHE